jgi:hypothetical protein
VQWHSDAEAGVPPVDAVAVRVGPGPAGWQERPCDALRGLREASDEPVEVTAEPADLRGQFVDGGSLSGTFGGGVRGGFGAGAGLRPAEHVDGVGERARSAGR